MEETPQRPNDGAPPPPPTRPPADAPAPPPQEPAAAEIVSDNRNVMIALLNSFEGVKVTKPDGTFYCFADFSVYEKDSMKLSGFLIDKVQVLTVPGVEFGMEGYLRLSYCGAIKDITDGIERMKWALDPNSPNELYIGDRKLVRDWS